MTPRARRCPNCPNPITRFEFSCHVCWSALTPRIRRGLMGGSNPKRWETAARIRWGLLAYQGTRLTPPPSE